MKNLQTYDEFLNEAKYSGPTLTEIKEELYAAGFKDDYPYNNHTMVQYNDSTGIYWQIYLNPKNPKQVTTLRREEKGVDVLPQGLIGNFVGGRGKYNAFSFTTPDDLKNKLKKLNDKCKK